MENYFVDKDPWREGNGFQVFKCRKKGSIEIMAVQKTDKSKRHEITHALSIVMDIDHRNVVRFHEWAEARDSLWMVVELCIGGTLRELIDLFVQFPVEEIRRKSVDLVEGLFHLHKLGVIYADLNPSKIVVDGNGALKYGDFMMARMDGEDLKEVLEKMAQECGNSSEPSNLTVSPYYMAPEVIKENKFSKMSDLWSLGAIMYEMLAGGLPYSNNSDEEAAKDWILNKPFELHHLLVDNVDDYLKQLCDVISGLLTKETKDRTDWMDLLSHSFWDGQLVELREELSSQNDIQAGSVCFNSGELITFSAENFGKMEGSMTASNENTTAELNNCDQSVTNPTEDTSTVISLSEELDGSLKSPTLVLNVDEVACPPPMVPINFPIWTCMFPTTDKKEVFRQSVLTLLYHPSDLYTTSIIDFCRVPRQLSVSWDSKAIPLQTFTSDQCLAMSTEELQTHWSHCEESLVQSSKGAQRRLHLLNYLASLAAHQPIVVRIIPFDTIYKLVNLLKGCSHPETSLRMCRLIALLASNCTHLDREAHVGQTVGGITEILRGQLRETRLRHALLTALGEILHLVARLEDEYQCSPPLWAIPSLSITLVTRCLHEQEDIVTNQIAAKIIENVSSTGGRLTHSFAYQDVCQALLLLLNKASEPLRTSVSSALCHLLFHGGSAVQVVLEKAVPGILDCIKISGQRSQQALVTVLGVLLATGTHCYKIIQDKDFFPCIIHLLDSSSILVRAKAFLVVTELCKLNRDYALIICNSKLIHYIEKDSRRQHLTDTGASEYLFRCLELLTSHLCELVPVIFSELEAVLVCVKGRKHPNAIQARQLKTTIPLLMLVSHLVGSHVFRQKIVNEAFIHYLGFLLDIIVSVDCGETSLESIPGTSFHSEICSSTLAIVDVVSQHSHILDKFSSIIPSELLPQVATLGVSLSYDIRAACLKIFANFTASYLSPRYPQTHNESVMEVEETVVTLITNIFLPHAENLLKSQDNIPVYTLKILHAAFDQDSQFACALQDVGLIPIMYQLLMKFDCEPQNAVVQTATAMFAGMLSNPNVNVDELYDISITEVLSVILMKCSVNHGAEDNEGLASCLLFILEALIAKLDNVANIVRSTIETEETIKEQDALQAECTLVTNKPLVGLCMALTQLLCTEDTDVQDAVCHALSLLVQLYGAECSDILFAENIPALCAAISGYELRQQKKLLKVIHRLVSCDSTLLVSVGQHQTLLYSTLTKLAAREQVTESQQGPLVSGIAHELIQMLKCYYTDTA